MRRTARSGLSLLEVLLALAVLGISLAVVSELVRVGGRNAEQARDISKAQIHCESIMAQVVARIIPATSVASVPVADLNEPGEWLYTVEVVPSGQDGLLAVKATVSQNPQMHSRPVAFSVGRWMLDPNYLSNADSSSTAAGASSSGM